MGLSSEVTAKLLEEPEFNKAPPIAPPPLFVLILVLLMDKDPSTKLLVLFALCCSLFLSSVSLIWATRSTRDRMSSAVCKIFLIYLCEFFFKSSVRNFPSEYFWACFLRKKRYPHKIDALRTSCVGFSSS